MLADGGGGAEWKDDARAVTLSGQTQRPVDALRWYGLQDGCRRVLVGLAAVTVV